MISKPYLSTYPSQTEGQDTTPWQKSSPIQDPKITYYPVDFRNIY